jgi:SWI/SNF-related matrix-associated actin-dependent regulator of chromatin subfamily A containing DEAD/H box 1
VVKLITKGSIEEDMLELGKMKLALDEAVAGEEEEQKIEREMKTSLMNVVRKKLEVGVDEEMPVDPEEDAKTEDDDQKMEVDS